MRKKSEKQLPRPINIPFCYSSSSLGERPEARGNVDMEKVGERGAIRVKCPAKINLTLEILNKRKDGFHNIQSIMQTIDLFDILTIEVEESEQFEIKLSGTSDKIPYDERNLVYKAAAKFFTQLRSFLNTEAGVQNDGQLPRPCGERVGVRGSKAGECLQYKSLYNQETLKKAKELRKNTTDAEKILWYCLRNRQICNLKFRRQVPIGNYIANFMCKEKMLIIELDGGGHFENKQIKHDLKRKQFLESEGYKIIRFYNTDVFQNLEGIIEEILFTSESPLTPTLSPQGRGSNAKISCVDIKPFLERERSIKPQNYEFSNYFNKKISIHIEKNIPIAAGLAGGSTDAAGTIWGLNEILGQPLTRENLHEICAQLGSDLNFCLEGGCQLTSGRGEILKKLPFVEFDVSLIKPKNLGISAKEAYTKFSQLKNKPNLNMTKKLVNALNSGEKDIEKYITNDLELAVINDYEELQKIKKNCPKSIMSGSGSTFFALISSIKPIDDDFWIKNGLKSISHGACENIV